MNIPTDTRPLSLLGSGVQQPQSTPADFGASAAAQGFQQVGQALGDVAHSVALSAHVKNSLDSERWVNDSMTQLRDYFSKWQADPENHTSETYADQFNLLAKKSQTEYEAKAPNRLAREQFRSQFQNFASTRYESALITTANTKRDRMLKSHADLNNTVVESWRTDRLIPDLDANAHLIEGIKQRSMSIDSSPISKIAPEQAKQLKNQLVSDAAYATMGTSPDLAKNILNMGTIEGQHRHAIETAIHAAQEATNSVDLATVRRMGENRIAQAKSRNMPAEFDYKELLPYLPDDKAKALASQWNEEINAYNTATEHIRKVESWSGPAQLDYLHTLQSSAGKDPATAKKDMIVLGEVQSQIMANVAHFAKDPGDYLQKFNPAVKSLSDQISAMDPTSQGQEISQKLAERDALMKQFQGNPPPGVTGDQLNQYHQVNRDQVKVMSEAEATAINRKINESSPQEAIATIQSELQKHPGSEDTAFNNLTTLQSGTGLRGDYWLLYMNLPNANAADLAGALQSGEAFKQAAGEKVLQEIHKALDADVGWKQWAEAFPADNFQREGMMSGIRNGLISYALARVQTQKESPEAAIKQSVSKWLYTEMAPAVLSGRATLVDRRRGDGRPPMTDAEVQSEARALKYAVNFLNTDDIKLTDDHGREHFPGLPTDEKGKEQLNHEILRRAYFKQSSDNKDFVLYIRSDTGSDFEARDKNNMAYTIPADRVPNFQLMFPYDPKNPWKYVGDLQSDIPLYNNVTIPRANWPIRVPPFMKMRSR